MPKKRKDDYLERLMGELNNQINNITMNNYDDIIKDAKLSVDNFYNEAKKKYQPGVKTPAENNINEKINKMSIGQNDLEEVSKYTRYYKYKVKVIEHRYSDKNNFVFSMDNSFFKKLLKKPIDRFKSQTGIVKYQSLVFKYNPKVEKKFVDDKMVYFKPFEIILSTSDCHDIIYYHTDNNGNNQEIIKLLYILNIQKVIDKLMNMFDGLHLSEKAKTNMILSTQKHLKSKQQPETYGVEDYEDYHGLSEEQALIIFDDFDDGDLIDPLSNYII